MRRVHTLGLSTQQWCLRLVPNTIKTSPKEQLRAVVGAAIGLFVTALISQHMGHNSPWFVAPIGASAVLVFTTPSSPLAQPWAVVGGNTLSALVGIACATYVTPVPLAGALAVALAMATMLVFRCIHPPGGAMALLLVLTHETTLSFVAFPVFTNSVLLAIFGMLYNSATGHPYPHHALSDQGRDEWADSSRFTKADLDTALAHYNEVLDVNPDDLIGLLRHTEAAAYQRTLGELRCQDIMTTDPIAVQFGTSLQEAWALMRQFHIKALPIVDQAKHVVGIVTVADFLKHAGIQTPHDLTKRMQTLLRPSGLSHSERPEVVGQIMTRKVRVASAQGHAVDLLPLFSAVGHHHLPVIDTEKKLIGILTQTDLVKALSRSVQR
jgi:CBS domain-containing membrane protein